MKTPRLALLAIALPALLLAPVARAGGAAPAVTELPKWDVVDEGFRAWPSVYFKVGNDNRELRCRYAECNPATKKGVSNLYLLIESGPRQPITSEVIELVPLGKYDPRRLWGTEYTQVTRKVSAHRQNYASQLSHFKLDNSGASLMVVQGDKKYPATTDINTVYVSETGGKIAVAPPAKKANDALKPDGSVTPAPPTRRPVQYRWCNPATGKEKLAAKAPGPNWTKLESPSSVCKKAGEPTTPKPPTETVQAVELSAKEKLWLTKGERAEYEDKYKVAADAGAGRASAMKSLAEDTRKLVVENLAPNSAAASAYSAAAADKDATNAKIDATLPAEVWGGANNGVVGPFGDRLDIQLSKEEWAVLSSSPTLAAALKTYKDGRKGADGNASAGTQGEAKYSADMYDPIQLHKVTIVARAAVGPVKPGPVVTPPAGGGDETKVPPLTAEEMKLLTPAERQAYEKLLQNVKDKVPGAEKALALESERLRALIKRQNRAGDPEYKAPTNLAEFNKLPNWHKDIFCDPKKLGTAAAAADTSAADVDNSRNARAGLENSAAASGQTGGGTATSAGSGGLPDWAKGPCAMYLGGKPPEPGNGGNGGNSGNLGVGKPLGPDANAKAKEEDTIANSWFMRKQIQTFAQGALIGLLIGSLFGPVGLIAGPLIGGALMYGMQKYDAVKAANKEKAEKSGE